MGIQPTTCLSSFTHRLSENKVALGITYLAAMVGLAVILALPSIPSGSKAIVGYSFLGAHVVMAVLSYPIYREYQALSIVKEFQKFLSHVDELTPPQGSEVEAHVYNARKVYQQNFAGTSEYYIYCLIDEKEVIFSSNIAANDTAIDWEVTNNGGLSHVPIGPKNEWTPTEFREALKILYTMGPKSPPSAPRP